MSEEMMMCMLKKNIYVSKNKVAVPEVFVPVFPGTNCEYDTTGSFIKAGASVNSVVFRNMTESDITRICRCI